MEIASPKQGTLYGQKDNQLYWDVLWDISEGQASGNNQDVAVYVDLKLRKTVS